MTGEAEIRATSADPPRATIALVMIVKDEAHVVTEAFDSVLEFIDTWCIVDTGSTDGTQDLIRSYFAEAGIPGELHEREWVDFAHNRTEALQLSRGSAEYALMMDADDLLVGEPDFDALDADAYMMRIGTGFTYWRTQLFKLERPWEYRGVLHEYAVCTEPCGPIERLGGEYHLESRRLGGRNLADDKYERDSAVLRDELERDPDDSRTVFYLAQSRMDAGDPHEAYDLYTRRTQMGGWNEEIFYSHMQRARALQRMGTSWDRVLTAYLDAWNTRPTRVEPLVEIARHYRSTSEWQLAHLFAARATDIGFPDGDLLFVSADAHNWQAADERSMAAYYIGNYQESFDQCTKLLNDSKLPLDQRDRVLSNRDFCLPYLLAEERIRPLDVIARLTERFESPAVDPNVTLTITTCRRRDLFDRSMDSFLRNCTDIDAIDRWICIDDGSSDQDRAAMAERYPFFEFIWKDNTNKGHARSMEILRAEVSSPYWMHLEDDWEFFAPDSYVSRAIAILEDDPFIGQVLFNRNYAELASERDIPGGELRTTARGKQPYRVHIHAEPGTEAFEIFNRDIGKNRPTNSWWPNFSFRPSMLRTSAINEIGAFSIEPIHFELEFAQRFTAAGLRSAFFDTICNVNIGTLTTETGPNRRPNAYELNGEAQFGRPLPQTETATVRLVSFWGDPTFLANHFSRQTKGDDEWNGIRLTDDPDADVTVILNHPGPTDVQPERSIVLHMEPLAGVATWGNWSDPNPDELLHVRTHAQFPNVAEWHLGSTWAELGGGHNAPSTIEKTRDLSVVVSNKAFDPGHKLRLAFVQHLASNNVAIDVFGRGAIEGVPNHKGELPEWDKRDGLLPYRYTIAAENFSEHNYVTEKFFDAILSECLCFYWGCPNLEQLVDPDVFVRLPLENPAEAQRIIEQAIADDLWSQRIDVIRLEKQRILDEYQLFPTIERVLTGLKRFDKLPVRVINLERRPDRWAGFNERLSTSANPATASKFVRVEGTDGQALTMTPEIEHLFRNNDFNFRRGMIGCALSHMSLWQQIADGDDDMMLIVEDDTSFVPHLRNELVDALGHLPQATEFDLAFLGSLQWDTAPDRTGLAPRDRWRPMVWPEFLGGTFAYLVTKTGARNLLELIERDGIQNGIDWFPMRHGSELRVLETLPAVASATMAWPGRSGDSDIQHDFEPVATELPLSSNSDRPTRSSQPD